MNAKEYINELNRELGGDFIYSIPLLDWSEKTLEAFTNTGLFSEEKLNQLREYAIQQSVGEAYDELLANIGLEIANEFNSLGYPLKEIPTIGILPTRDFNAWALKSPNADSICILDVMLWGTITGIALSFTECVFEGKEKVEGNRKEAFFMLLAYLLWFSGVDRENLLELCKDFHEVAKDPLRRFGAGQLILGMMVFIIAHEFAHHALGHVGTPETVKLRYLKNKVDTTRYNRTQINEFAADKLGFLAFIRYARTIVAKSQKRLFSQGEVSPLLFFHFLDIYEKNIIELNSSVSFDNSTHPSAKDRLSQLLIEFEKNAHSNAKVVYSHTVTMFEHLHDFIYQKQSLIKKLRYFDNY